MVFPTKITRINQCTCINQLLHNALVFSQQTWHKVPRQAPLTNFPRVNSDGHYQMKIVVIISTHKI